MSKGVDFTSRSLTGAHLKAEGVTFACRYLSGDPGGWKELSLAEAKELNAHGIKVVSNWEQDGHPTNSVAHGKALAAEALAEAQHFGHPLKSVQLRPIYFSIDYNASVGAHDLFFQGCADQIGADRVGVYAGSGVVQHTMSKGYAKWGWRSMSTGWIGGSSTKGMHIEQTHGAHINGIPVDINLGLTDDVGGWVVGAPEATSVANLVLGSTGASVKALQAKLKLPQDGIFGPHTLAAVITYQKSKKLVADGIVGPKTRKSLGL
jgi:hypothetical protein